MTNDRASLDALGKQLEAIRKDHDRAYRALQEELADVLDDLPSTTDPSAWASELGEKFEEVAALLEATRAHAAAALAEAGLSFS